MLEDNFFDDFPKPSKKISFKNLNNPFASGGRDLDAFIRAQGKELYEHIEAYCAAYLRMTHLDPRDVVLIQEPMEYPKYGIRWYFQLKKENEPMLELVSSYPTKKAGCPLLSLLRNRINWIRFIRRVSGAFLIAAKQSVDYFYGLLQAAELINDDFALSETDYWDILAESVTLADKIEKGLVVFDSGMPYKLEIVDLASYMSANKVRIKSDGKISVQRLIPYDIPVLNKIAAEKK